MRFPFIHEANFFSRGSRHHWGFGSGAYPGVMRAPARDSRSLPSAPLYGAWGGSVGPAPVARRRVPTRTDPWVGCRRLPAGVPPSTGVDREPRVTSDAARTKARGGFVREPPPRPAAARDSALALNVQVTLWGRPGPATPTVPRPATGCQPCLRPSSGCPLERPGPPRLPPDLRGCRRLAGPWPRSGVSTVRTSGP
jgi:hypothetical protein